MAVTFDQVSTCAGSGVGSLSWTHTPTGTPTAVGVGMYWFSADTTVTAVSYGGTAMTQAVTATDGSSDVCRIYGLANPASGAKTVSLTIGGDASFFGAAGAITVTGSDTTTCFSAASPNSATGSSNSASVTITSAIGELIMACGGQDPAGTLTAGNTSRWGPTTVGGLKTLGDTAAGAASQAMTFSSTTSNPWAIVGASFQAAAATNRPVKMAGDWGGYAGSSGGFAG